MAPAHVGLERPEHEHGGEPELDVLADKQVLAVEHISVDQLERTLLVPCVLEIAGSWPRLAFAKVGAAAQHHNRSLNDSGTIGFEGRFRLAVRSMGAALSVAGGN